MKLDSNYPIIYKKINRFLIIRKILLILFAIALLTSIIINLTVGGNWFIYVLGGEVVFYYAFLDKPLIDNILIRRISILFLVVICFLYAIDKINFTNWSNYVIEILSFSLLIIQLLLFFLFHQKIIIMLITSFVSVIFCLLGIFNVIHLNWAVIVIGSLGLLTLVLLFSFYFKITVRELKKYFSIK